MSRLHEPSLATTAPSSSVATDEPSWRTVPVFVNPTPLMAAPKSTTPVFVIGATVVSNTPPNGSSPPAGKFNTNGADTGTNVPFIATRPPPDTECTPEKVLNPFTPSDKRRPRRHLIGDPRKYPDLPNVELPAGDRDRPRVVDITVEWMYVKFPPDFTNDPWFTNRSNH